MPKPHIYSDNLVDDRWKKFR